jgi:hypothetical protein
VQHHLPPTIAAAALPTPPLPLWPRAAVRCPPSPSVQPSVEARPGRAGVRARAHRRPRRRRVTRVATPAARRFYPNGFYGGGQRCRSLGSALPQPSTAPAAAAAVPPRSPAPLRAGVRARAPAWLLRCRTALALYPISMPDYSGAAGEAAV